jgi:hypothetical protein
MWSWEGSKEEKMKRIARNEDCRNGKGKSIQNKNIREIRRTIATESNKSKEEETKQNHQKTHPRPKHPISIILIMPVRDPAAMDADLLSQQALIAGRSPVAAFQGVGVEDDAVPPLAAPAWVVGAPYSFRGGELAWCSSWSWRGESVGA